MMLKHLTDLIVKVSILPFSDARFLKNDPFEEFIRSIPPKGSPSAEYSGPDGIYKKYRTFQKDTSKLLQHKHMVTNPDMVNLLIEKYFPLRTFETYRCAGEFYLKYIRDLAKCFICHRDGGMAFKYWLNDCYNSMYEAFDGVSKLELWNSFSRQFCMDLLVCSYLLDNGMEDRRYLNGYYWLLNLGDMQLDRVLERGVAETHIHINAGIHFVTIWEQLLNLQTTDAEQHPALGAVDDFCKKKIRMAAVSRRLMCEYLSRSTDAYKNLEAFCDGFSNETAERVARSFAMGVSLPQEVHYKMVFIKDPSVRALFDCESLDTTDENVFLLESLKYLRSGIRDSFFSALFWNYIRLKNIVYQSVTQNDYQQGLIAFQEYYHRATGKGSASRVEHFRQAIKNQVYNNHLQKLEIRISSYGKGQKSQMAALYGDLRAILGIYKELLESKRLQSITPQIGVVFHMLKRKDETFFEKCWCLQKNAQYFYGALQKEYLGIVEEIAKLRNTVPGAARLIVGIDAASIENDTEPWVFAPVFRAARDSMQPRFLLNNGEIEPVQSLGFTYHVGEEFRHLVSGLRHIDEVVQQFGYHAGDRIGHGIAMGEDVEAWTRNNAITVMPRVEYLENLLWIWGLGYNKVIDAASEGLSHIEREIMEQASAIYRNLHGITIYALWKAYQKKFERFQPNPVYMNEICGDPHRTQDALCLCCRFETPLTLFWDADKLLHAYHCKCYLERMYEVIQVKVDSKDTDLYKTLQYTVRERLDRNGIIVETNPTSNLVISGMEHLFSHQAAILNPCGPSESGRRMILTINSDDPVVFNTSISNELAYIFYLLLHQGYSRDMVLEWIDKIRTWGLETSFLKNDSRTIEQRKAAVNTLLEQLR